jgi:BirA family biotin operon repressor/biotin-[acetyl-CoA-carboxylase] ligase
MLSLRDSHWPVHGPVHWPVHWYDRLDSTNEEARRIATGSLASARWIAAHEQIAGRGRLARVWASPAGNLYASALLPVAGGLAEAAELPFVTAIAVADAVEALLPGLNVRLKWPNDIRVNGAKLGGILIETLATPGQLWAIVGIGLNVRSVPEGLDQPVASLAGLGAPPGLDAVTTLEALRAAFATARGVQASGFANVLAAWTRRAEGLGETVSVSLPGGRIEGRFDGLEADGAMRLRLPDDQFQRISAGDVRLVREG